MAPDRRWPGPVLLFGANGQVGGAIQECVGGQSLIALDRASADLGRPETLHEVVIRHRPWAIINAAAYTAVDRAESEVAEATAVNAEAPEVLAQASAALGAVLVHYSTDYVFDGRGETPYREDDAPAPLSVYGRTKLEGEHRVRAACESHLIFRTSWVYAARGANFLRTMLRLAGERDSLRVVADQFGAPTPARLLAASTVAVLDQVAGGSTAWGTYHLTASGHTTWHGFAREVIQGARRRGFPVKVRTEAVAAIATSDYPTPAPRPRNSRLDTTKIRKAFDLQLPPWEQGVADTLDELLAAG